MKFRMEISMDNAAFEDSDELGNLIRQGAEQVKIQLPGNWEPIRDSNGNTVGKWEITAE